MINDFTLSQYRFTQDQLAHLNVKIVYNANSTVYSAEGWKFERDARDYRTYATVTKARGKFSTAWKISDRKFRSDGTVQYFSSVHKECWTARRRNPPPPPGGSGYFLVIG